MKGKDQHGCDLEFVPACPAQPHGYSPTLFTTSLRSPCDQRPPVSASRAAPRFVEESAGRRRTIGGNNTAGDGVAETSLDVEYCGEEEVVSGNAGYDRTTIASDDAALENSTSAADETASSVALLKTAAKTRRIPKSETCAAFCVQEQNAFERVSGHHRRQAVPRPDVDARVHQQRGRDEAPRRRREVLPHHGCPEI